MTQADLENPSPGNGASDAGADPKPAAKAAWSSPTLNRLDGKETQGIAPKHPAGASKKQLPEEMVFFGS